MLLDIKNIKLTTMQDSPQTLYKNDKINIYKTLPKILKFPSTNAS